MKTAFLVLDLMNDIVDSDGPSGSTFAAEAARRNVQPKTALSRLAVRAMRSSRSST